MNIKRLFNPADRYVYDFGLCSISKGYAQIDTDRDARYFGTWINPTELKIVNYCEGDITITECVDRDELADELRRINEWNIGQGYKPIRIDAGLDEDLPAKFSELGLAGWLH